MSLKTTASISTLIGMTPTEWTLLLRWHEPHAAGSQKSTDLNPEAFVLMAGYQQLWVEFSADTR